MNNEKKSKKKTITIVTSVALTVAMTVVTIKLPKIIMTIVEGR